MKITNHEETTISLARSLRLRPIHDYGGKRGGGGGKTERRRANCVFEPRDSKVTDSWQPRCVTFSGNTPYTLPPAERLETISNFGPWGLSRVKSVVKLHYRGVILFFYLGMACCCPTRARHLSSQRCFSVAATNSRSGHMVL